MTKELKIHKVEPFLPALSVLQEIMSAVDLEIRGRSRSAFSEKKLNEQRKQGNKNARAVMQFLQENVPATDVEKLILSVISENEAESLSRILYEVAGLASNHGLLTDFSNWFAYRTMLSSPAYFRWEEGFELRRRLKVSVGRTPKVVQQGGDEITECNLYTMTGDLIDGWIVPQRRFGAESFSELESSLFNLMIDYQDIKVFGPVLRRLPVSLLDDYLKLLEGAIRFTEKSNAIIDMEPRFWTKAANSYLFFKESRNYSKDRLVNQENVHQMTPEATRIWHMKDKFNTMIITDHMVEVTCHA